MKTMYPAYVNSPDTVTMGAISPDTTTVTVQDVTKIPDAPNLLVLGGERPDAETVLLTAISGTVLTIQRGVQGRAKSWADRTTIARNFTAYDHEAFRENILTLDTEKLGCVPDATAGNLPMLTADGAIADSGKAPADFASTGHTHTAAELGVRPDNWTPTAQEVGADPAGSAQAVQTALDASKVNKSTSYSLTLMESGWTGTPASQTLSIPKGTVTSVNELYEAKEITAAQLAALRAADLADGGQAAGTATFTVRGEIPAIDIPVMVIVREDL